MDTLCIKELQACTCQRVIKAADLIRSDLPDDIARLQVSNRLHILLHRTVVFASSVQEVTVMPVDVGHPLWVELLCASHDQGKRVLPLLVEDV
jgi:hypothetical protein